MSTVTFLEASSPALLVMATPLQWRSGGTKDKAKTESEGLQDQIGTVTSLALEAIILNNIASILFSDFFDS